jgi:glycosyltransferase involved in cell wall biosynthesis
MSYRLSKKIVYSSSPDRGLATLLEMWPAILAEEPEAELHCFYGMSNWEKAAASGQYPAGHPFLSATALRRLKHQLRSLPRVVMRGRVSERELAYEFRTAGVWAYPTWFHESSCITAMQAQAAGLYIVATPIAALNETVADRGTLVRGAWESGNPTQAERTEFVGAVIRAIRGEGQPRTREELQAYARENFGLDSLAKDWDVMLRELVERVAADVVPKFRSQP